MDQQRRRTEWRSVRRLFPNRRAQQMAFCSAVAQQRFCSAFCWAAACSDDRRRARRRTWRRPNKAPNSTAVGQQANKRPSVGRPVRATEPEQNAILFGAAVCLSRVRTMQCQELMIVTPEVRALDKKEEIRGA